MPNAPVELTTVEDCVDYVVSRVGTRIVLGAPLGLGKPNQLINAFYRRAVGDPTFDLTIFTALSLEKPTPASDIETRFLAPYLERHFGTYVDLEYMKAIRNDTLPRNVKVHEFYFSAGSMKGIASAQQSYVSTNYTFVARDLLARGVNVLVQLVAEQHVDGRRMLSLSSNTDVTLDAIPMLRAAGAGGRDVITVAQTHADLPFMYNRAMVEPGAFDVIVRNPTYDTTLFAAPNEAVTAPDFAIGIHASTLVRDGGTLQIGIGSLGDAVVYALQLRHEHNDVYRKVAAGLAADTATVAAVGGLDRFERGLYGCSEMFVSGFSHLMTAGILKREVFDDIRLQRLLDEERITTTVDGAMLSTLVATGAIGERLTSDDVGFLHHWGIFKPSVTLDGEDIVVGSERIAADLGVPENRERIVAAALGSRLARGIVMHGGFFLGPAEFYEALRRMSRAQNERIGMDSVRRINRLDAPELQTLQRRYARFVNTGMMVTLGGAVVSDGLENGQVISGVGGQYNFVAQAHELPDARSVICIRAVRGAGKTPASNIVASYGHATIPRHLRDIVVTEYGVADLRAKSDEEIIQELLSIADSRFQDELLESAKAAGKIDPEYEIPERYRSNTPEWIAGEIATWSKEGYFPAFPLGTDLTDEEIALGRTLRSMKAHLENPQSLLHSLARWLIHGTHEKEAAPFLERLGLAHPNTAKEIVLQRLLMLELEEQGYLEPL